MANVKGSNPSTPWHTDRWLWTLVKGVVKR